MRSHDPGRMSLRRQGARGAHALPVTIAAVAGFVLTVVLVLCARGMAPLALLLVPLVAGGLALGVVAVRRRRLDGKLREQRRADVRRMVEDLFDEWIASEATRGFSQMERWRRTHSA